MSFLSRVFNLGRGVAGQLAAGNSTTIFTDGLGDAADPINHYSNVLDDISVVANAVDKICKAAMTTNPLCTLDKKYVDTTATKLLEQASKTVTGDELLYKVIEDLHKGGDSYVILVGNFDRPATELVRIDPRKVSTTYDHNGDIKTITIYNDVYSGVFWVNDDGRFYNKDNPFVELVRIAHPSGRGILNSCRDELDILSVGLQKNGLLVKNGGRVSMLLNFKDNIDENELVARTKSVERAARSKGYGGFLSIVSGENGLEVKEMGLSPKDMDFAELQRICKQDVYNRLGVPLPLVDNSAATYENMANARIQLYTETVIPLTNLVYSKLGAILAIRDKKPYKTLTDEMKIPAIRDMLITEMQKRKLLGIETINELRALIGLAPVVGGDRVYIEAKLIDINATDTTMG